MSWSEKGDSKVFKECHMQKMLGENWSGSGAGREAM